MFGIGWTEFIMIALVLLIFVGPRNLPPLLQKIGKITAELRNASRELRNQLDMESVDIPSPRQIIHEISKDMLDKAALPYEEAAQADRELKQATAAIANDILSSTPEPDAAHSTAEGPDVQKLPGGSGS